MNKSETTKYYIAASVAFAAFVVYLSCLQHQFILWDDNLYVYDNLYIRSLGLAFFEWAFDFHAGNWHPLTWISHALDYAVWGLNPMGHHLTNNILHAVNTFLVVLLITRLLEVWDERAGEEKADAFLDGRGKLIAGGVTGLLFGLHPLHVESVAWVSERKDLLCSLFFLLSVMCYMKYLPTLAGQKVTPPASPLPLKIRRWRGSYDSMRGGAGRYYIFSLIFFVLALMSKPMAVSLPIVLLILDWYPFGRFGSLKTFRTVFIEKLPFITLSLVSSIVTVFAQRAGSALASMEFAPLQTRVLVGFKALIAYLWKMVLPVDLVPFYPYPKEASPGSLEYISAIVLVMVITIACIAMARRQKLWLSAWGYYVITLIPVLGIVQVGQQSMADRYTYLPSLGPFLLVGLAGAWVWAWTTRLERGNSIAKLLVMVVSASLIVSLSYLTFRQTGVWKNSIVFWSYVIEKEPEKVPVAYYNRGIAFDKMGMLDRAIADYDRAIALKPEYYDAYNNRGLVFEKEGQFDKAIIDLETAMAVKTPSPEAYNNLGMLYRKTAHYDRAIENYNKAIALKPSYPEAYYNRAIVYEKVGRLEAAIDNYSEAIKLNPSYYEAYYNMGVLYANADSYDKAIDNFTRAIQLNPTRSSAYMSRGVLYAKTSNKGAAISDFEKTCELGNNAGCTARDTLRR